MTIVLGMNHYKRSVNLEKNWNSQFFQKRNETREKFILRALKIVFSSLVRFLEELIIPKITFEIY